MDYLFLAFVVLLVVAGLVFVGVFIYRLFTVPEFGVQGRKLNLVLLPIIGLVVLVSLGLALFGGGSTADWGAVIASGAGAFGLVILSGQGFWVGFKQMDEDGVGFLRFFQLGSSIILCLAFAPAFFAFITYATKLR